MPSNQQRFLNSKNDIRFSSKMSSKIDGSRSLNRGNFDRRTSGFMPHNHVTPGKSVNLPPVEPKVVANKTCYAVDLLQLANTFSKSNAATIGSRRSSKTSGILDSSINSAPDCYLKQKRGSLARQSYGKPRFETRNATENPGTFANSWPLAPIAAKQTSTRLPHIPTNNYNDCDGRENVNNLRGSFAKFNQSRSFRMKQMQPQDGARKPIATNANGVTSHGNTRRPSEKSSISDDAQKHVTIETVTALRINGSCKKPVCDACKKPTNKLKPESTGTDDSEFTHVTEESVRAHPDNEDNNEAIVIDYDEEESRELDRKCIKWLEDVARERSLNPDKVFLPHLLMS